MKPILFVLAIAVITALPVAALAAWATKAIVAHVKNHTVATALSGLVTFAAKVVASLQQTVVADAKVSGRFDTAMARDVKATALAELSTMGASLIASATAAGGSSLVSPAALGHMVEAAVNGQKVKS